MRFGPEIQQLGKDELTKTLGLIRQIWSRYDKDGNGYLNKIEAKDFVDKYFKYHDPLKLQIVDDAIFSDWFKSLDDDGDGLISIIEMANYLKVLGSRLNKQDPKLNPEMLKRMKTRLTVADVMQTTI